MLALQSGLTVIDYLCLKRGKQTMINFCPKCGKSAKDVNFCPQCGFHIAAIREIGDKGKISPSIHDKIRIPLKEKEGCDIRSHLRNAGNDDILQIFYAMCQEIKGIDTKGSFILVTNNWLNFYPDGSKKYFICTKIQKSSIYVGLKIKEKLDDPRGKAKPSIGYGYNYIFKIYTLKELDYSNFLIKQAYDQLKID